MFRILTVSTVSIFLSLATFAQKNAPKPEASVKPAQIATYTIDTEKSEVAWAGKKVLVEKRHHGTVKLNSGKIEISGKNIVSGQFEINMKTISDVDMKSDEKNQKKLEGHLMSDDFFNAEKFPVATFVIKSVKPLNTTGATHEITGDLTIRDKTKSITFPATIAVTESIATAKAGFKVDRSQFDVKYASDKFFQSLGDKVIANEMEFNLDLTAKK